MREICIVYQLFYHSSSVLRALRTGTRGISFLCFATEGELGFYANPSEEGGNEEKEGPGRRERQRVCCVHSEHPAHGNILQ